MKRIIILGPGGAGKSTLAIELGKILNIEVIHLDSHFWKPGWVQSGKEEWQRTVEKLLEKDSWIMDGNFGHTREMRAKAADTIIFLELSRIVCLLRVIKRILLYRGKSRPDMTPGCDEHLDWEFFMWIWNYPRKSRPGIMSLLAKHKDKQILHFTKPREVWAFLKNLKLMQIKRC